MSRRPPQNGLFCWWLPNAGPTGSQQLVDRSNNENHGTLNGVTPSTDWVVDGGWALNFDATNNYVVSNNNVTFQSSVAARSFSFSGWIKTATAGFGSVFGAGITTANDPSMFLRADATNNTLLQWFVRNAAGTVNFSVTSTSAVNTDKWIHVAAIMGGNGSVGARLYINGVEEGAQATYSGGTASTWDRFGIGATIRLAIGTYFSGCMDDVRLFSRPLTASEVRSLYLCGRGAGFREGLPLKYSLAVAQDISLNLLDNPATFHNATISSSNDIACDAIPSGTTFHNATITTSADITLNAIPSTTTFHLATISLGDTISLLPIGPDTTFYPPVVSYESTDTSDILTKPARKRRRKQDEIDEENVAAQLLQERQLKGIKPQQTKQPFNIKIELEKEADKPLEAEVEVLPEMSDEERQQILQAVESYQTNLRKNKQLRALLMLATMDEL